jgi:hypothetical protein
MQTKLLLELLAARQAGSGQAGIADVLARLRPTGDGEQSSQALLSHLAQSNPMIGMLATQFGVARDFNPSRAATVIDGDAVEVGAEVSRAGAEGSDSDESRVEAIAADEASRRNECLLAELRELRERVDQCAAAIGACGACWGTDPGCRACRGRGRPGFSMPDEALFEELIIPAVRMVKARRAQARAALPASTSPAQNCSAQAELAHHVT